MLKGLEQWINISILATKDINVYSKLSPIYFIFLFLVHVGKQYKLIKYYKTLLKLNKAKFHDFFLDRLKPLISNIYNKKKIHLNIVNLKTLYFNSDIFTQAIALKLKNRDNRLLRVLRSALYLIKLPKVNIIRERYNKTITNRIWSNKVKNLNLNLISNYNDEDRVNNALFIIFSNNSFIGSYTKDMKSSTVNNGKLSLLDFLLKSLKHKSMAGVRLEAKGRLTRRFTASRSVFKIKWKGGIRNIDSSYRGLPTVMLRGHVTSNTQYSIINSKTRNGAFGIKGWIGNK